MMRVFNRVLLAVVLVVILVFATFSAVFVFAGDQYKSAGLPGGLAVPGQAEPISRWLHGYEQGSIAWWHFALLIVVFVAGLALLILELLPGRRAALMLGRDSFLEKEVVERAAVGVAQRDRSVLEARASLKPKRHGRGNLKMKLTIREGEDTQAAGRRVGEMLQSELTEKGQLSGLQTKIKVAARDPRTLKTRVK